MTALKIVAAHENKSDVRQQPASDHGADNADHNIADKSKAITLDKQARQPAGNSADDQPNDDILNCHDCPHDAQMRAHTRPTVATC